MLSDIILCSINYLLQARIIKYKVRPINCARWVSEYVGAKEITAFKSDSYGFKNMLYYVLYDVIPK